MPILARILPRKSSCLVALVGLATLAQSLAQSVQVGAGSYTTALPAGATAPQGTIYRTYSGPVATHKWWTAKNWNPNDYVNGGPYVMFPEPLNVQGAPIGLVVGTCPAAVNEGTWFFRQPQADLTLGVAGINAQTVNISAFSDWTVDFNFGPMTTRIGRGMPFVYAFMNGANPTVTFATVPTIFSTGTNILGVSIGGNNYGLFGPAGSTWSGIGTTVLTCNLPSGHAYFSLAVLPSQAALTDYEQYAFSFPTNTQVAWSYNPSTSQVSTTYTVTTQAMEGTQTGFLMALYPHQYGSLSGSVNTSYTYASARGPLEVNRGNSFTTVDIYHGILPYLPPTGNYNAATLQTYLDTVTNEGNHFTGGDTYNIGLQNARIAHLLPIAESLGTTDASSDLTSLLGSLESNLSNWFTATPGKSADVFYYDSAWGTLIGYPAGYGSDTSLNDHHFHYGYWIHSAAIIGLYDPAWIASSKWGGMVTMLANDIANPVRGDSTFPFLRYFDVYGGHSWASGQAPFLDGGNEESSSEAVNAWTGLILYATETNNTQLRDTAIWLYTQETKGVQYYWFNDGPVNTFPAGFTRKEVANVFDDKSDTGTWFGSQIEFEHGIEFLPFHGGSAYLGQNIAYNQANWAEILQFEGVSTFNPATANWPDLMEEYQAFFDPTSAINNWNNNPANSTFDGETQAHEYYWLHNMQALGNVDYAVTANTPLYGVYKNPSTGVVTHIAYNTTSSPITVSFSDSTSFIVAANSMQTGTGGNVTAPTAPSGLSATATSSSQINLSWTASSTSGVTYTVYRSTTSGFAAGSGNQIASGLTATNYSNGGLNSSTTYYYLVQAVNGGGNSPSSNQASATTQAQTVSAPTAPSGLTATATSSSQINLSWTASSTSGVTYSVYRSTTSGFAAGSGNLVTSGLSATSYSNTGLAASTTYYYLVQAVNSAGNSGSSNQATATTQATVSVPSAPSGLTATAASASQINLSWTASSTSGVTYTVYRSTSSGFTASSSNLVTSGLTATSYSNSGLSASTAYYYLVQAVNSAGNSGSSNQATATTQAGGGGGSVGSTLYVQTGATSTVTGALTFTAGTTAGSDTIPADTGGTYDGTPHTPLTYLVTGVSGTYSGAATQFTLNVDSKTGVGNGVQVQVLYDFTGSGTWSRVETYHYFATDDVVGYQAYTQAQGLESSTGTLANMSNGRIEILVWNAIGTNPAYLSTSSPSTNQSVIVLPYTNLTSGSVVPPSAPSGLAATAASSSQINLTWTASSTSGVTYSVYRSTSSGFTASSSNLVTSGLTATSYSNTGLSASTAYYYLVQAVGPTGTSASSNEATATTQAQTVSAPAAPSGLTATAASSSQINLSWTASSTSGVTYSVYRSTTSGFAVGSGNLITSGLSATSYSNTGLAASTTYFYLVQAVNSGGNSPSSNQASATTQAQTVSGSVYISAGGPTSGSFVADVDFSGGTVAAASTATINTTLLPAPVPSQSVLQHERYGAMTYTIPGLLAGKGYTVSLVFAELYWTAAGQREFNVLINGTQVLTNFDILANAGAANKAIQESFSATANASGQVVIQFTVGAADQPKIDGIEVY